jgi:protein-disulfide isomerase
MSNAHLPQSPENKEVRGTASKVRLAIWAAIIIAMLAIVGVVVFANTYDPQEGGSPAPSQSQSASASSAPANITDEGGVVVSGSGTDAETPKVLVYIDFICPACQQFEKEDGAKLQEMAAAGTISLEYRPIAILDRASTSKYSSRALNTFACVADSSPEHAVAFMNKLMDEQPKEGTAGLTNEKLAEHASSVGAVGVEPCVADGKFLPWTKKATDKALGYGLTHTPFVVVNDVLWDNKSDLFAMVAESKVS